MANSSILDELNHIVGEDYVLVNPDELLAYECDGLTFHRAAPDIVVMPASTEEVARLLELAARHSIPFVARGAGTGLSGGAQIGRARV